jgi:hypothetical protein
MWMYHWCVDVHINVPARGWKQKGKEKASWGPLSREGGVRPMCCYLMGWRGSGSGYSRGAAASGAVDGHK